MAPLAADDEWAILQIGTSIMSTTVTVIGETILWAIYLVLFFWALWLQISTRALRNPSLPRIAILTVTVFLFLSATALWVMNISWLIIGTKAYFMNAQDGMEVMDIKKLRDKRLHPIALPMELFFCLNMILGDAVVIWRAWVICRGTRLHKFVFIPIFMLLTSLGFTIFAMHCLASDGWSTSTTIPIGERVCKWAEPIAWGVSLVTNLVSTALIAIRAWHYRRFLREGRLSTHRFRVHRILIMLVESGFIYCLFWLTQVVIFLEIERGYKFIFFLRAFLYPLGDQISGIYSTLIIIVVHLKRSINDASFVGPGPSTTDVEPERSRSRSQPPHTHQLSTILFTSHGTMPVQIDPSASVSDLDVVHVLRGSGERIEMVRMDQK
ncbi:hypothetical protein AAF712_009943 [Marasmius tenuissimus]|uniref:Integral membrane protein n=1 Tax=Marasmius tenuissimus TaxID=585030 RepID=A0ABR2ZR13_9AGAR